MRSASSSRRGDDTLLTVNGPCGGVAVAGWTDQAVLERLLMMDVLGARSQRRVVLLPTAALNTEAPFYEAFHNRRRPAVLHLMGRPPAPTT
jgi:hypothetical protein